MGLLSFQSAVFTSKKSERKKKDRTRLVEENFFVLVNATASPTLMLVPQE